MPHRVSPTERIRGHIDELFAQDKQLPEILEEVARLGAQLLMQAALEAEITSRTASSAAASSSRAARASRSRALTASSSATRARSCSTSPQAGGCGVPDTAGQHHSRLTVIKSTRRARSPTSHHGSPARTSGTAGHWGPADLPAESAAADVVAMPLT